MGGRMSRVEVSDEELAQRLLEGGQTALRALLAGDEAQIRAAEAALRDAEGALHAGLRDLGMQPDQATSSLPVGAQELLGQSQHKSQGLWGVGRAQLAMAMSAALSAAAAAARLAGDQGGGSGVRLSASTRRRLSEVADRLRALHPAD